MPKYTFGTLDVTYPASAYVVLVFFYQEGQPRILYPFQNIFTSLDDVASAVEECAREIAASKEHIMLVHECVLLVPIIFEKYYPLKKRFWEHPCENYDIDDRMRAFLQILDKKVSKKKLLVPPSPTDKKQITAFSAALPYLEKHEDMIEKFMLQSDLPVEIRAKHAAIYEMGEILVYNWQIKEFEKPEDEILLN